MTKAVLDDVDHLVELRVPAAGVMANDCRDRVEALVDRGHRARTGRRRVDGRGSKLAFARSGFCSASRRASGAANGQVASGVSPISGPGSGWVACWYDPTTGTFITRDPMDGINGTTTEANPYHYVDNDPVNKVDPLGLRPRDTDIVPSPVSGASDCSAVNPPQFITDGRSWNQRPDPDGATAQVASFDLPVLPCKGMIRVNGFIASRLPQFDNVPLVIGAGDDRPFNTRSTARESRMSFELNFVTGQGQVFVNYSCTVVPLKRCFSADPIAYGAIDLTTSRNWSGFSEVDVRCSTSSSGANDQLDLKWNVGAPESRVSAVLPCAIVGGISLDLSKPSSSRALKTGQTLRDFPSTEVYQYTSTGTNTLFQQTEASLQDLCASR